MITVEKLKELLSRKGESPNLEFKLKYSLTGQGNNKNRDEAAKDIIALANTAGRSADDYAYLIIGAGDDLRPDGTRSREDVRQHGYDGKIFLSIVNDRCAPGLPDLWYEEIEAGGNYYGVIVIPPSPYMHELTRNLDTPKGFWPKGAVLLRRGDGVGAASYREMQVIEREKERLRAVSGIRSEVSELLSKVHSGTAPLAQCVAEALTIAKKLNDSPLERFCVNELRGWVDQSFDDASDGWPKYRLIDVYAGPHSLNMLYAGFAHASNTLDFLRKSEHFQAARMPMRKPLAEIEAQASAEPNKGVGVLTTKRGVVEPGTQYPDDPYHLYFSPHAFANILQGVRAELTEHLVHLLPEARAA